MIDMSNTSNNVMHETEGVQIPKALNILCRITTQRGNKMSGERSAVHVYVFLRRKYNSTHVLRRISPVRRERDME
jgi:hypothetical protein